MNKNLTHAQQRAIQYWFVDGLAELAAGLVSLLLAILFSLWQVFFIWRWSLPILLLTGLLASFGLRLVIQRIKERTTYPRTGYAAPLSGVENKGLVAVLVAFTILLLGLNYYLSTQPSQTALWSPGLAGLVFGFLLIWTGVLIKLRRFIFLGAFSFFLGVMMVLLGVSFFSSIAILCGVVGMVLILSGIRNRRQYMRQNPPLTR